jgi:transposase-like protein
MDTTIASDPNVPAPRVEVITSFQRRRWCTVEKVRLVEKSMQPGSSVSLVVCRYEAVILAGWNGTARDLL